jgi:hypothetical protein
MSPGGNPLAPLLQQLVQTQQQTLQVQQQIYNALSGSGGGSGLGGGGGLSGGGATGLGRASTRNLFGSTVGLAARGLGVDEALGAFSSTLIPVKAAVGEVSNLLSGTARNLNVLGDSTKSANERMRELSGQIPVFGQLVQSAIEFGDALNGVADALRRGRLELEVSKAVLGTEYAGRARILDAQNQLAQHGSLGASLGGLTLPASQLLARSSYTERIAYENERRREGLADEQRYATARRQGAEGALQAAVQREQLQAAIHAGLTAAQGNAEKRYQSLFGNEFASRKDTSSALNRLDELTDKLRRQESLWAQSQQQTHQARLNVAQSSSAERKANLALTQNAVTEAEGREQRLGSQAERFGRLDWGDQMLMAQFARRVRAGGIQSLIPMERQMFEGMLPAGALAGQYQQLAEHNPAYRGIQADLRAAGIGETGNLGEARQVTNIARQVAREAKLFDERMLANDLTAAFQVLADRLGEQLRVEMREVALAVRVGQRQQAGAGGI